MTHATALPEVEELTDNLLNWFGWYGPADYPKRGYAMIVAANLFARGIRANTLTNEQAHEADTETGGHLTAMWDACHNVTAVHGTSTYVPNLPVICGYCDREFPTRAALDGHQTGECPTAPQPYDQR